MSGDGGGYPEGFYVNYYMHHWLLACEAMRICTGADWLAEADHMPAGEIHTIALLANAPEGFAGQDATNGNFFDTGVVDLGGNRVGNQLTGFNNSLTVMLYSLG